MNKYLQKIKYNNNIKITQKQKKSYNKKTKNLN